MNRVVTGRRFSKGRAIHARHDSANMHSRLPVRVPAWDTSRSKTRRDARDHCELPGGTAVAHLPEHVDPTVPIAIAVIAVTLLALGAVLDDRRARVKRREQVAGLEVESVLPLLHSINDDRCIGCEACIDVCPTSVLDLVQHKVRVARFSDCVQCEQCANSCPTMALVMYRKGTTPRMLTVPELDENFQTGVPGQYLIGEVAGKPLVKNAANLGRAVIEHITKELAIEPKPPGTVVDVAIVGSGPSGLSAALTCIKRGLSCVVLEKEHVISSTVSRYPKGKHFMAEPADSANVSFLPVFDGTKEELVAAWQRVVEGVKMPIKLGEAVETVKRGDDGVFSIKTTVATYKARRVVLATGLRGKPRLLSAPGANLEKVQSLLDDPQDFAGEDVLVVGGGDSAVEGALALANVNARVTLSYRGDGFKRCKQDNQRSLAKAIADGRLDVLLESNVAEFTTDEVKIKLKSGEVTTIPNQRAFVLIGADTPVVWLEANNVRFIERPHLYALGSSEAVVRRIAPDAEPCTRVPDEAIALVLGKQQHKKRRVLDVVDKVRHEIRDVATSVSVAFRLSDLEEHAKRTKLRTPVRGVTQSPPDWDAGPTRTVITTYNPFDGNKTEERTNVDGRALRPVVRRVDPQVDQDLDAAFERVTSAPLPRRAPPRAKPAPVVRRDRPNPFDDDNTAP